ncbi:type II toxin-antitoxin system RelE/ParE family toxin [Candidatus Sumerlaeota bacterium]|nr:type II toxin-antitoxin system RelE/ParE family toxin [Candidatus Sumerlaeota bacterium]
MKIVARAEKDLEEIWDYIARDNIRRAERFVQKIEREIRTLELHPARCARVRENQILGTDYRQLLLGNYRLIFRMEASCVLVLRIVHVARLLDESIFVGRE